MHLSSILFPTCDFCRTPIRGEVVKHSRPNFLRGVSTDYYHASCFFVFQQRELESKIKNPRYKSINNNEAI